VLFKINVSFVEFKIHGINANLKVQQVFLPCLICYTVTLIKEWVGNFEMLGFYIQNTHVCQVVQLITDTIDI